MLFLHSLFIATLTGMLDNLLNSFPQDMCLSTVKSLFLYTAGIHQRIRDVTDSLDTYLTILGALTLDTP